MASLKDAIDSCVRISLPYFERDDKDDYLYIATHDDIDLMVNKLAQLVEENGSTHNNRSAEICANRINSADCMFFAHRRCTDIPCAFYGRKLRAVR